MANLTPDIKTFLSWLEIRETNGQSIGDSLQLRIDADHSGLLRRMLAGEEPLPEAPPLAHSYPWAELIKTGRGEPWEVYEAHPEGVIFPHDTLIIDQSWWYVLEKTGTDDWVVTYKTPDVQAVSKAKADGSWWKNKDRTIPMKPSDSRWRIHSTGPDPRSPERKAWVLERLP